MANAGRWLWEALVVVALVAALFGVWTWSGSARERALEQQAQEHEAELSQLERGCETWADRLGESQARQVFQAFAAGVHAPVLAGRRESVDLAVGQLLELPGVVFVHLLEPNGAVMASSDRKLVVTGQAGERASWALAAGELTRREGERRGTVELAAPIRAGAGTAAILWLGYDARQLVDRAREQTLDPGRGAPDGESGERGREGG